LFAEEENATKRPLADRLLTTPPTSGRAPSRPTSTRLVAAADIAVSGDPPQARAARSAPVQSR